jgi:hypothetical protein
MNPTVVGKLRRGRRRLICRITGHDWGDWETSPFMLAVHGQGTFNVGPVEDFRECQRCPKTEWRRP